MRLIGSVKKIHKDRLASKNKYAYDGDIKLEILPKKANDEEKPFLFKTVKDLDETLETLGEGAEVEIYFVIESGKNQLTGEPFQFLKITDLYKLA